MRLAFSLPAGRLGVGRTATAAAAGPAGRVVAGQQLHGADRDAAAHHEHAGDDQGDVARRDAAVPGPAGLVPRAEDRGRARRGAAADGRRAAGARHAGDARAAGAGGGLRSGGRGGRERGVLAGVAVPLELPPELAVAARPSRAGRWPASRRRAGRRCGGAEFAGWAAGVAVAPEFAGWAAGVGVTAGAVPWRACPAGVAAATRARASASRSGARPAQSRRRLTSRACEK